MPTPPSAFSVIRARLSGVRDRMARRRMAAPIFRYSSRIYVTLDVTADSEQAAWDILDYTGVRVRACGRPVRRRAVRLAGMFVDGDPEPLPETDTALGPPPAGSPSGVPAR